MSTSLGAGLKRYTPEQIAVHRSDRDKELLFQGYRLPAPGCPMCGQMGGTETTAWPVFNKKHYMRSTVVDWHSECRADLPTGDDLTFGKERV